MHVTYARKHKYRDSASYKLSLIVECITLCTLYFYRLYILYLSYIYLIYL